MTQFHNLILSELCRTANTLGMCEASTDPRLLEMFAFERERVLRVTNYLEALYARLTANTGNQTATGHGEYE